MPRLASRKRSLWVLVAALLLSVPVFGQEKPPSSPDEVTTAPAVVKKDEKVAPEEVKPGVATPQKEESRSPGDFFGRLAARPTRTGDSSGDRDELAQKSMTFALSVPPVAPEQAPAAGATSQAQPSAGDAAELAKKSQNPVSDLISVPFQSNWNYGVGPERRTQYVLNIQPVIPVKLSEDWSLITRVILPITYQPIGPSDSEKGTGDTSLAMFFSPAKPGKLIWGIGPQFLLRTASDTNLGSGKWGAGPTIVALTMPGHFVLGVLASNIWSFAGDSNRQQVNVLSVQYFINYNLPKARGFAITSAPTIQANWQAPNDQRWVVPFGGGIAQTFVAGKQPMSLGFQLYYNVVRPDNAPNWNLRFQLALLFPKKG